MTKYQAFVQDQIAETVAMMDRVGQSDDTFAMFFSEPVVITWAHVATRLERLAETMKHPDFETLEAEYMAIACIRAELEVKHAIL